MPVRLCARGGHSTLDLLRMRSLLSMTALLLAGSCTATSVPTQAPTLQANVTATPTSHRFLPRCGGGSQAPAGKRTGGAAARHQLRARRLGPPDCSHRPTRVAFSERGHPLVPGRETKVPCTLLKRCAPCPVAGVQRAQPVWRGSTRGCPPRSQTSRWWVGGNASVRYAKRQRITSRRTAQAPGCGSPGCPHS